MSIISCLFRSYLPSRFQGKSTHQDESSQAHPNPPIAVKGTSEPADDCDFAIPKIIIGANPTHYKIPSSKLRGGPETHKQLVLFERGN